MKIVVAILIIVISFSSQLPILSIFSLSTLFATYLLFWRPDEPKVLFFGLAFFWLTIPVKLYYADVYGISYESLSKSPNIIQTTYLSLVGYMVFAGGIYLAVRKLKVPPIDKTVLEFSRDYSTNKILIVFLISFFANIFLIGVLFAVPSLVQLISGFLQMKLGFIFLLVFAGYAKGEKKNIIYLLLLFEVIISFFGIFSNFVNILITLMVSLTIFNLEADRKRLISVGIIGIGCLYIFLIWQAVKGDYRQFLTGGAKSQVVVVERGTALNKLWDLMQNAKITDNPHLWYETVDRMSYIEFFSQATDNVPKFIPYEEGQIWKDNVLHIFMPRIFFPNKKSIDDSQMVNKYCTDQVMGAATGTTFSLGFMAEAYIDFGPILMFLPVLFVGWLSGFFYKLIIEQSKNVIWGFTMAAPLWYYIKCNGTPGTKVLGFLIMYYVAFYLFNRFLLERVDKFMRTK